MRRGNIERLPRIARELIDKAIVREGFSNYKKLAEEFKRFGKGISKSSIHRYAVKLERFQQAARVEAEVMASFGDTAQWLIKWARDYPRDAERLVTRLKKQAAQFATDHDQAGDKR